MYNYLMWLHKFIRPHYHQGFPLLFRSQTEKWKLDPLANGARRITLTIMGSVGCLVRRPQYSIFCSVKMTEQRPQTEPPNSSVDIALFPLPLRLAMPNNLVVSVGSMVLYPVDSETVVTAVWWGVAFLMPRVRVLQAEPDQIGVSLNVTIFFSWVFFFLFFFFALLHLYLIMWKHRGFIFCIYGKLVIWVTTPNVCYEGHEIEYIQWNLFDATMQICSEKMVV